MWETLRRWEHARIDWGFDHPWVFLIPILLYGGFLMLMWFKENRHFGSDAPKLRVYRKKRK